MIEIKDTDLPITVAEKIITGTKPYNATPLPKAVVKALAGDEKAGDTVDMLSMKEIKEIADYLMMYYDSHKEGDWMDEERFKRECEEVKRLGDQIGYGNMMTIASALWAKMLIDEGCTDIGAFYPTILSNMKPGDLTVYAMKERTTCLQLFKKWEGGE